MLPPHHRGPARALLSAMAATVLLGCAPSSVHVKRDFVSGELEHRAGYPARSETGTTLQFPPGVAEGGALSEDDAVAMALWNNAAFQESLSKLGLARGDLAQAGFLSNPTFSILFPLGPKQLEFAATFPLEALWLRPRRVTVARIDAERVAEGLVQNGLDLIRDVRAGLSGLELARDRARLSRETASLQERIARIIAARFAAGEGSELESIAAQAQALGAREDARRREHEVTVAQERLAYLLGMSETATNLVFSGSASTHLTLTTSLADLERRALAARPDLRASELAVEAAGRRAGLARAEIFALSGILDANAEGKEGLEIGPGLQLPIPIFNQNQAGRARAAAEIERAAWNYLGTRQRVLVEVREAYSKNRQAFEALDLWNRQYLPSLEEWVRGAEKAYELGDLPPLTVQENTRQLLAARLRQAELAADARLARAELERSVGTRISDRLN